jgi:hypothetical protein
VQELGGDRDYEVKRTPSTPLGQGWAHVVCMDQRVCCCGEWQVTGILCVDAMAVFRHVEEYFLEYILDRQVLEFFHYETPLQLVCKNICAVIIDSLVGDGNTKPPKVGKKQPGCMRGCSIFSLMYSV